MQENYSRAIALIMVSDLDSIKGCESIQSAPPNTVRKSISFFVFLAPQLCLISNCVVAAVSVPVFLTPSMEIWNFPGWIVVA